MTVPEDLLIPANRSAWVMRGFLWWVRKMLRKQFYAVRVAGGTRSVMAGLNERRGPAIVVMNHSSWWDPLIGLMLARELTPQRLLLGPMEAQQLRTFTIFRKLGIFGIDPDQPASLDPMIRYVSNEFARDPRTLFVVTPQGAFADVRSPVRLRPGAAALAARLSESHPDLPVVCVATELGFWVDQRPEIFIRFAECAGGAGSTTGWLRSMTSAMSDNAERLATLVIQREPAAFEVLLGGRTARINPVYDLWQTLRGRKKHISATARTPARRPVEAQEPA